MLYINYSYTTNCHALQIPRSDAENSIRNDKMTDDSFGVTGSPDRYRIRPGSTGLSVGEIRHLSAPYLHMTFTHRNRLRKGRKRMISRSNVCSLMPILQNL